MNRAILKQSFISGPNRLALYHNRQYSDALFALEEADALVPGEGVWSNARTKTLMAIVHKVQGVAGKAEKQLERVRREPDYVSTGLILSALQRPDKAMNAFRKVSQWDYFAAAYCWYLFPALLGTLRERDEYEDMVVWNERY